jgi:hypothetical protein
MRSSISCFPQKRSRREKNSDHTLMNQSSATCNIQSPRLPGSTWLNKELLNVLSPYTLPHAHAVCFLFIH